jgi:sodium-dependent phosphate cotransporter
LISSGLALWVGDRLVSLFSFAQNPFLGLGVGLLATALVQSSSAVTTILVGLVASGLPVAIAVPMVMGANIGTTVTNTIASLGFLRQPENFERAFAAATIHDFFNLLALAILFPLEIGFHGIENSAHGLAATLQPWIHAPLLKDNLLSILITWPQDRLIALGDQYLVPPWSGITITAVGAILLLVSIMNVGQVLRRLLGTKPLAWLTTLLPPQSASAPGPLPWLAALTPLAMGAGITALVQSSSVTTSLLVPLAATDLMPLTIIYPVTLGANLGTCLTSLLAAIAVVPASLAAVEIALVHFLFNGLGVLLIYGLPGLRRLPLWLAQTFAQLSGQNITWVIGYVAVLFFLLPLLGFWCVLPGGVG